MTTQNPFVGPRIFEESDAHLFFGREADADALLSLVLSRRLVLFYAPSGAGKSSLIRARLIPDLRSEGFHVLPIARVGGAPGPVARAGGNVFTANLLRALQPSGTTAETTTLTEFLAAQARPTDAIGQPAPVALFIDQFEEIVTTNLDRCHHFFVSGQHHAEPQRPVSPTSATAPAIHSDRDLGSRHGSQKPRRQVFRTAVTGISRRVSRTHNRSDRDLEPQRPVFCGGATAFSHHSDRYFVPLRPVFHDPDFRAVSPARSTRYSLAVSGTGQRRPWHQSK